MVTGCVGDQPTFPSFAIQARQTLYAPMDRATGNTITKTKAGTFFWTSISTAIPNSGTSTDMEGTQK